MMFRTFIHEIGIFLLISTTIIVIRSNSKEELDFAQFNGAEDASLLKLINERFLDEPSSKAYNLKLNKTHVDDERYLLVSKGEFSYGFLMRTIKEMFPSSSSSPGFFVEAGALDGEFHSTSLYLEKKLNWTGLLVEPDAELYRNLRDKNRKAWSCHCCLGKDPLPYQDLLMKTGVGKRDFSWKEVSSKGFNSLIGSRDEALRMMRGYPIFEPVHCFALQSLLFAIRKTKVDLILLDVEDYEENVLSIFPFDKILVDVWIVEHRHPSTELLVDADRMDLEFVKWFEEKGYALHKTSPFSPKDYVFVRKATNMYQKIDIPH